MALYDIFIPESLRAKFAKGPEELSGLDLIDYLVEHPDTRGISRLPGLTPPTLARLLARSPHYADQCDFSKIPRNSSAPVIVAHPELLDRFDPAKLDWKTILRCRPELVKLMPRNIRMSKSAWVDILCYQPELWDHSPFQQFDTSEWAQMIRRQPRLGGKCPWRTLVCDREWRLNILLYPDLILPHREDWKQYYNLDGCDSKVIAGLLAQAPHLESMIADFGIFTRRNWIRILKSQPQFIVHCEVKKIFQSPPLELLVEQPGLADHFDWENLDYQPHFMRLIQTQPQLAPRMLNICRSEEWEFLLPAHPEYFLKRDPRKFSFRGNVRASLLAGLLDFEKTGLDPICNRIYDVLEKRTRSLDDWWDENFVYTPYDPAGVVCRVDFTPAELMIESVMDSANAKCFFLYQLRRNNWNFIAGLLDCDPEALSAFLSPVETAFVLTYAAPEKVWSQYFDRRDAAAVRDKNGNTLLHAALLRAVFGNIGSLFGSDDPHRAVYDRLLARGCDPDLKNKPGVSCNDLLNMIRNRIGQLKGELQP